MVFIVLPVYMLFVRDTDDDAPSTSALVEAAKDPRAAADVLTQATGDREQGIEVRYPSDWKGRLEDGVVRVTGPNKSTVLAVAAKAKSSQARALFGKALEGIGADLKGAKVTYLKQPGPVGGLPSAQALVTGTRGKTPVAAVVAVAKGRKKAYVVSILGPKDSGETAVANLIMARGLTLSG